MRRRPSKEHRHRRVERALAPAVPRLAAGGGADLGARARTGTRPPPGSPCRGPCAPGCTGCRPPNTAFRLSSERSRTKPRRCSRSRESSRSARAYPAASHPSPPSGCPSGRVPRAQLPGCVELKYQGPCPQHTWLEPRVLRAGRHLRQPRAARGARIPPTRAGTSFSAPAPSSAPHSSVDGGGEHGVRRQPPAPLERRAPGSRSSLPRITPRNIRHQPPRRHGRLAAEDGARGSPRRSAGGAAERPAARPTATARPGAARPPRRLTKVCSVTPPKHAQHAGQAHGAQRLRLHPRQHVVRKTMPPPSPHPYATGCLPMDSADGPRGQRRASQRARSTPALVPAAQRPGAPRGARPPSPPPRPAAAWRSAGSGLRVLRGCPRSSRWPATAAPPRPRSRRRRGRSRGPPARRPWRRRRTPRTPRESAPATPPPAAPPSAGRSADAARVLQHGEHHGARHGALRGKVVVRQPQRLGAGGGAHGPVVRRQQRRGGRVRPSPRRHAATVARLRLFREHRPCP